MDADPSPGVGLAPGKRHGRARALHVGADRDHAPHPGGARPLEDRLEVARELREVQVRVRVDEVQDHIAPRTPAAFLTAPDFTQRIAPQRPTPVATASIAVTLIFAAASLSRISQQAPTRSDRKSTRLNSSHVSIS